MTKYCPKCRGEIQILGREEFYVVTNSAQTTYHAECPGCGWRSPGCRDSGTVMDSVLSTPRATRLGATWQDHKDTPGQWCCNNVYTVRHLPAGLTGELELGTCEQVYATLGASATDGRLLKQFWERAEGKLVLRVGQMLTIVEPQELRRLLDLVAPPEAAPD